VRLEDTDEPGILKAIRETGDEYWIVPIGDGAYVVFLGGLDIGMFNSKEEAVKFIEDDRGRE
jgi:hypothetical protein